MAKVTNPDEREGYRSIEDDNDDDADDNEGGISRVSQFSNFVSHVESLATDCRGGISVASIERLSADISRIWFESHNFLNVIF